MAYYPVKWWRAAVVVSAVSPGMASGLAAGQSPDPGHNSTRKYELDEHRGIIVTMRGGVHLSVDIYAPSSNSSEKRPGLLSIWVGSKSDLLTDARYFAKRGYVASHSRPSLCCCSTRRASGNSTTQLPGTFRRRRASRASRHGFVATTVREIADFAAS